MPWGPSSVYVASYAIWRATPKLSDEMVQRANANEPSRSRERARRKISQLIRPHMRSYDHPDKRCPRIKWDYLRLRKIT